MNSQQVQDKSNNSKKRVVQPQVESAGAQQELGVVPAGMDTPSNFHNIPKHASTQGMRQAMVQRLQGKHGNQAIQRLLGKPPPKQRPTSLPSVLRPPKIQPKLAVNEPNDVYEKEADTVADEVMKSQMPAPPPPPAGDDNPNNNTPKTQSLPTISRLQRQEDGVSGQPITSDLELRISDMQSSGGSPLPDSERAFMEPRMGADLGNVCVHTGESAIQTSRELNAKAYTVGSDIAFNEGEYALGTASGRGLLAHELTHTVQQGATVQRQPESEPTHTIDEEQSETRERSQEKTDPPTEKTSLDKPKQTEKSKEPSKSHNGQKEKPTNKKQPHETQTVTSKSPPTPDIPDTSSLNTEIEGATETNVTGEQQATETAKAEIEASLAGDDRPMPNLSELIEDVDGVILPTIEAKKPSTLQFNTPQKNVDIKSITAKLPKNTLSNAPQLTQTEPIGPPTNSVINHSPPTSQSPSDNLSTDLPTPSLTIIQRNPQNGQPDQGNFNDYDPIQARSTVQSLAAPLSSAPSEAQQKLQAEADATRVAITTNSTTIQQTIETTVTQKTTTIQEQFTAQKQVLQTALQNAITDIDTTLERSIEETQQKGEDALNGFDEGLPDLLDSVDRHVQYVTETLQTQAEEAKQARQQAGEQLGVQLETQEQTSITYIGGLLPQAVTQLTELVETLLHPMVGSIQIPRPNILILSLVKLNLAPPD